MPAGEFENAISEIQYPPLVARPPRPAVLLILVVNNNNNNNNNGALHCQLYPSPYYGLRSTLMCPAHYLITHWRRVFLGKLTGSQLIKKFPAFYATQRLITAFTSARHLPQPKPVQSMPQHQLPEDLS